MADAVELLTQHPAPNNLEARKRAIALIGDVVMSHLHKRALNVRKRALYIRRKVLYVRKRPL